MNSLAQFGILLSILFISEQIVDILKLSIPSTILGMLILLLLLLIKVIKLSWVEDITKILTKNLPILFVPTIVGVMEKIELLKGNTIKLFIVIITTSILIIVTTAIVIDKLILWREK